MSTTISDAEAPSLSERRRQASRELMRAEILNAAQHIIRTDGMDALSLRALAKSVGVTAPALYEYFPNKEAILRALFVQGSQMMLGLMNETLAGAPPGILTLKGILDGYRDFARDEPDYFRLLFGTVDPNLEFTADEYSAMATIFERFTALIVGCIEVGDLQAFPPSTLSCALWATVHGVATLENDSFMASKDIDHDGHVAQFEEAVKLMLASVATPKGAALIGPISEGC